MTDRDDESRVAPYEMVLIGGSAGGIEALRQLLPELPREYGLAVVLVLHQHRHGGPLTSLLAAHCALPVAVACDKDAIVPGHLYVSPANYHLLVEPDRTFSLSADPVVNFARPSIDVSFESAARVFRDRLVGVLLSGSNADGALGLAAIRARGGIVACQEPSTAIEPAMVKAGIAATTVDWIESPRAIGVALAKLRP